VLNSYLDGSLVLEIKFEVESDLRNELAGLQPEEAAVLAMLRARLKQAVDDGPARACRTPLNLVASSLQ
jgi:DNA topoisomerase-1